MKSIPKPLETKILKMAVIHLSEKNVIFTLFYSKVERQLSLKCK